MTPAPTPPLPGSMTVPPLFGWQEIVLVLGLLLVVAVAFFVASAAGRSASGRSEFQAMLAARSARFEEPGEAPASGDAKGDAPGFRRTSP
jgi:hypothetical protein